MSRNGDALPTKIAHDLLLRIVSTQFPPGTMLPSERELQESYGVSRTVVREAIKLLAARGLVTTVSGQGAVVGADLTRPATDALLLAFHQASVCAEDVLNARLLLEPQIAALAAQNASAQQLRRLRSLAATFDTIGTSAEPQARAKANELWRSLDPQLHELLAEASQNPVLAIVIKVLVGILWHQREASQTELSLTELEHARQQHNTIIAAVIEHNAEGARAAMITHLETTRAHLANIPNGLQGIITL